MRAFYRGYHAATGRRAGQVGRLHIMREDGKFPGRQGLCGVHGWGVTHSPPVLLDPMPAEPPDGLAWCRSCIGHAADLAEHPVPMPEQARQLLPAAQRGRT